MFCRSHGSTKKETMLRQNRKKSGEGGRNEMKRKKVKEQSLCAMARSELKEKKRYREQVEASQTSGFSLRD